MDATQEPVPFQRGQVSAHGFRRDVELHCQLGHVDTTAGPGPFDDRCLPLLEVHVRSVYFRSPVGMSLYTSVCVGCQAPMRKGHRPSRRRNGMDASCQTCVARFLRPQSEKPMIAALPPNSEDHVAHGQVDLALTLELESDRATALRGRT